MAIDLTPGRIRFITRGGVRRILDKAGVRIRNGAVKNLTGRVLNRKTGRGASSVFFKVRMLNRGGSVTIGSRVFYLRMWELFGHGAYTIVPRRKKALKIPVLSTTVPAGGGFTLTTTGGFILRSRVNMPAVAKKPWLEPAFNDELPAIRRDAIKIMAKVVEQIFTTG